MTIEERRDSCIGLMYQLAWRFARRCCGADLKVDPDEFVAVAFEALDTAARTFKPEKGFAFTTYASACMHFKCVAHSDFLRGYRKGHRNLKASSNKRVLARELKAEQAAAMGKGAGKGGGRKVTLARRMAMARTEPAERTTFGLAAIKYDRAAGGEWVGAGLEREEERERAGAALAMVDERTRGAMMLKARGGSLKMIAEELGGVCRERARQVVRNGVERVRAA